MGLPDTIDYPLPAATELPEPVVSWKPDPARCALLLHDLQPHFLRPVAPGLKEALVARVDRLAAACRCRGIPVAHTRQPGDQSPQERGLLADFWGPGPRDAADLALPPDPRLAPRSGEAVIDRRRYNAFLGSDLGSWLDDHGRDQIIVCGLYAHIGCLMTVAHAFMTDRQPFLVADAIADFTAAEHRLALEYVAARCGAVLTAQDVIAALNSGQLPVDAVRAEVAALIGLPVSQVGPEDDLAALGLDSMRRMALIEDWSGMGIEVDVMAVTLARRCTDLAGLRDRAARDGA